MTEEQKYEIIKKLVETGGNKDRAAKKLGCTKRHINRLINLMGKDFSYMVTADESLHNCKLA